MFNIWYELKAGYFLSISTLKVRSSDVVTRMSLFQGQNSADVNGAEWQVKVDTTSCL